jgi:hypothetical protein
MHAGAMQAGATQPGVPWKYRSGAEMRVIRRVRET